MTAAQWLESHVHEAPAQLRERMLQAVESAAGNDVATQLANAALACLQVSLQNPQERSCALDLLAADALLTHACEAAAEQGSEALIEFAQKWDAARFEELLTTRAQ